ncbi:MAG TPA: hypothetical protein VKY19_21795 [Ktedonosporobacter sp.]|nr:hypothetical protein [Ktedonosporobacter sp.]
MLGFLPGNLPVAANPRIYALRASVLISGSVCAFGMIIGIYLITLSGTSALDLSLASLWAIIMIGLFGGFFAIGRYLQLRSLQDLEPRRLVSAGGDLRWLAPVQLTTPLHSPSVPLVISRRPKRTYICFWSILVLGGLSPSIISLLSLGGYTSPSVKIIFIIFGLALVAGGVLPFFFIRDTIEATDDGLKAKSGKVMNWQEARLFACYRIRIPIIWGSREIIFYELSSQDQVIFWRWMLNPQSLLSGWKPLLRTDVYHQRMRELCELIVVKTGLQLYDLSQPEE